MHKIEGNCLLSTFQCGKASAKRCKTVQSEALQAQQRFITFCTACKAPLCKILQCSTSVNKKTTSGIPSTRFSLLSIGFSTIVETGRDTNSLSSRPTIYPRESQIESSGKAVAPALVNERVKYTSDLARLSTSNPILAFTLTVVMFSIAGIPPLAGFYSKAFLMFAAIGSANYVLAIVGVAMSVVSAFYYLRIVKIMYFESLASPGKKNKVTSAGSMLSFMQINKEISLVCALMLSFLLFFSLHPKPVFLIAQKAALLLS